MSPRAAVARSFASSWPGCCPGPGQHRCTLMLLGRVSSFPELSYGEERGHLLSLGPPPESHTSSFSLHILAWVLCSASPHLPALQIVRVFQSLDQNLPSPESLLGLPKPSFMLPSAFPVMKLTCPLKSVNYLLRTKWFLILFSESGFLDCKLP